MATLKGDDERLKTILVVSSDNKIVMLDRELKPLKEIEGVQVDSIISFGASKSAVFGTVANGKVTVWDLTSIAKETAEYLHEL